MLFMTLLKDYQHLNRRIHVSFSLWLNGNVKEAVQIQNLYYWRVLNLRRGTCTKPFRISDLAMSPAAFRRRWKGEHKKACSLLRTGALRDGRLELAHKQLVINLMCVLPPEAPPETVPWICFSVWLFTRIRWLVDGRDPATLEALGGCLFSQAPGKAASGTHLLWEDRARPGARKNRSLRAISQTPGHSPGAAWELSSGSGLCCSCALMCIFSWN